VRLSVYALDPNSTALNPSARMAPNGHFKTNFNGILAFDLKHKKKKKNQTNNNAKELTYASYGA
jgi:hypothetical protein